MKALSQDPEAKRWRGVIGVAQVSLAPKPRSFPRIPLTGFTQQPANVTLTSISHQPRDGRVHLQHPPQHPPQRCQRWKNPSSQEL